MTDVGGETPISRRKLLSITAWGTFLVAAGAVCAGLFRFMVPNALYEPPRKFKLGLPDRFAVGSVTAMPDKRLFIFRDEAGIHAISAECPHLGCLVQGGAEGFTCACHGSWFDSGGAVKGGPAPKALPWYRVSLSPDGQIVVDKGEEVAAGTRLELRA